MNELIHKASHYNQGKYECIEVMREIYGDEMVIDFIICNAFKYLWRFKEKGGTQDIAKCKEYLNMLTPKDLEVIDTKHGKRSKENK